MAPRDELRRRDRDGSDEGSVLILVLVLVVISSLVVVPMLRYASTTLRANSVVVQKTLRQEAVKSGLRVALADPLRLYEHCGTETGGSIGAAIADGRPINDIQLATTCDLLAQNSAQQDADLHLGVAVTKAGATVPAGMTAIPRLNEDGTPVLDGEGNAMHWVYETGAGAVDGWWNAAAWDGVVPNAEWEEAPSATSLVVPRHVWLPHLPSHGTEIRTTSYLMPDGYSMREGRPCRVLFPGLYRHPVLLDQDVDYYFTSGIYYFEDTVTVTGNADVVVGMGSADGCVSDQEAAFYAIDGPSAHEVSGLGATFVFGSNHTTSTDGRLVVRHDGSNTPTIRFNQRYVHPVDVPGYASYGVSIASVNGRVDLGDVGDPNDDTVHALDLPGLNSVPLSRVGGVELPYELDPVLYPDQDVPDSIEAGRTTDDHTGAAYQPSALTYEPGAPVLDAEFEANVQFAAAFRTANNDNAGAVVIRWQHPDVADMNGAPIQSYTITPNRSATPSSCTWTAPAAGAPVPPLECEFRGLPSPSTTAGETTTFSIVANNGKTSDAVERDININRRTSQTNANTRPLVAAPGTRPTITNVRAHNGGVVVSFNPLTLAQSGNAPVKEYTVHYRNLLDVLGPPAGTVGCKVTAPDHFDPNSYTPPVDTLSCVIPLPLVAPLQPYSFQVTAVNYNDNAATVSTNAAHWTAGTLLWAPNPSDPLPTGPAPTAWTPFVVPEKVPTPIIHIDLSQDNCAAPASPVDDVVVEIPGYVATPQGLFQVDNPCQRTQLSVTGGVLAADIALHGDGEEGGEMTAAIGIENPLVQRTVKIVTRTTNGSPTVVSTAVVQINETGEYRVNSWEVQ